MAASQPKPSYSFLLHTFHATGHVLPAQAIAHELVQRGHRVFWLTHPSQSARVLASGATFLPTSAIARADAALQSRSTGPDAPTTLAGCADLLFGGGRLLAQVEDLRAAIAAIDGPVDCLVNDALPQGAVAVHELGELGLKAVLATLGVVPMYLPRERSRVSSALGMLMTQHGYTLPVINPQRVLLGLPPLTEEDVVQYSPVLHIQASCPSLEYNPADGGKDEERMPNEVHYVGPLVSSIQPSKSSSEQKHDAELPPWWPDVLAAKTKGQRVVFITQGTFAVDPHELVIPAVAALIDDASLLLVVTTPHEELVRACFASTSSPKEHKSEQGNVRMASWVPYAALLPHCSVLVTNGGYGSVTQALAAGVPIVCAGASEDKRDTAARVVHVGVGFAVAPDEGSRLDSGKLKEAVRSVLGDDRFARRARELRDELHGFGGAGRACDILESAVERARKRKSRGDGRN